MRLPAETAAHDDAFHRVLVLAPDAIMAALRVAGFACVACADRDGLLRELTAGAALAVLADDKIGAMDLAPVAAWVAAQPSWSDFPFIVLTSGSVPLDSLSDLLGSDLLGNVLFVEEPAPASALLRGVRTALRSRRRQYELRRRLEELREREQQLRIAQQAGGIGTFELFPRSGRLMLSAQFCQIYGLAPKDRYEIGDLRPLIYPDDLARVRTDGDFLPGKSLDDVEYRIVRPDTGEIRWIARRGVAIADAETGADRYLGVVYDITVRKQTEERLAVSEGALRLATDAAEIGTWDLDLLTNTLTWSERTSAMFGVSPGLTSTMRDFYAGLHPDDLDATTAAFLATLDPARRTTYDVEYRTVGRDDGIVRWVAAKGRGLFDANGRCVRAVGTAIDITARKAAESRHLLLLKLADDLRLLSQPDAIMTAAAETLGRHLGASRVGLGQVQDGPMEDGQLQDGGETVLLVTGYTDGIESLSGSVPLVSFGRGNVAGLRRGRTGVYDDVSTDPRTVDAAYGRIGTKAVVAVPFLRDGRLRAVLSVHQRHAQHWLPEDVTLIEEVAGRIWDAVERGRTQEALAASEAELRLIADALPVLIGFVDRNLVYRFANRAYQDWFFRPPEAAIGRTMMDFLGEADFAFRRPYIERVLAGETVTLEADWAHQDGRERIADIRYLPRLGPDGTVQGFYIFVLDVTDRHRLEAWLRQANEALQERVEERTRDRDRLWDLSQELMLVCRYGGAITAVNPSFTRVLGWREAEIVGRTIVDFLHPDDAAAATGTLDRLAGGAQPSQLVHRYRAKDGGYRLLDWTAVPHEGFVHAVARDVTEERARQSELAAAQDQLRQAQKMEAVGQLTGGIAHDFNNLLQGITGSLELTKRRIAQGRFAELDRFIGGAMTSAQRAASLTHRLLAFSRRQPLDPKPVRPNPLVSSMEDLLRRTLGEQIRLELVLAKGLWLTLCDPNQLENAILNLCINARDAMPEGGKLTVETANTLLDDADEMPLRDIAAAQYVLIAVTDTGVGMSKDTIDRAFDPFFTTKPIGQGTGLGLSMIYGFARQSNGHAKIRSAPGEGTTVRLYLPRHAGDPAKPDLPPSLGDDVRPGNGDTVLVIEDEAVVRSLIVDVLTELGYRAIQAADGPGALRILDGAQPVDLLITDIGLPGLNGRQVVDAARVARPDLKVLFMTGYAEAAVEANGFLEDGMAMITKPFSMEALAARIRVIMGHHHVSEDPGTLTPR